MINWTSSKLKTFLLKDTIKDFPGCAMDKNLPDKAGERSVSSAVLSNFV